MLQELRRAASGAAFDEQPMPDLGSEAIDFRAASESFAPIRPLRRRDLDTLRLVTECQGRKVPTIGGVLLFGVDRERHIPDAWIQSGCLAGTDKSRILDRVEFRALPVRAIEASIAFIEKHSLHGAEIGAVRGKERWNLPPVAVREAMINAVTHADYAQRGAPDREFGMDIRIRASSAANALVLPKMLAGTMATRCSLRRSPIQRTRSMRVGSSG